MTTLIIGSDGILGSALLAAIPGAIGTTRRVPCLSPKVHFDLADFDPPPPCDLAYLCAGTKGFAETEGNRPAFRADVDGNIRAAKHLLRTGAFVVFISTDAADWGAHTAYARNRLLVEIALVMQPNVAIIRPKKFDHANVAGLVDLCIHVGASKHEGLHFWPC